MGGGNGSGGGDSWGYSNNGELEIHLSWFSGCPLKFHQQDDK